MSRHRHRWQPASTVILTVVWVLLWDRVTLFIVLTGLLLAIAVALVFPLPPIGRHGRVHPVGLARLIGRLLLDLVRSSASVVALAFRFGSEPRSAVVRVRLRSRDDLYLTQTAELVSLVPGSIVLEAHRASSTLYLHVLDTTGPADLERAATDVLAAEARVLRAFGSTEEIAALDAGRPMPEEDHA